MPILTIKTTADQAKFDRRFYKELTDVLSNLTDIDPNVSLYVFFGKKSF